MWRGTCVRAACVQTRPAGRCSCRSIYRAPASRRIQAGCGPHRAAAPAGNRPPAGHEAADKTAAKLQTRGAPGLFATAYIHPHVQRIFYQPGRDFNDVGLGYGEADHLSQARGDQLIGQHADVLRIVLKLDHPELSIGTQHQLRLRAARMRRMAWTASTAMGCCLRLKDTRARRNADSGARISTDQASCREAAAAHSVSFRRCHPCRIFTCSARTAWAIAMAVTQSSWAPGAALVLPFSALT